MRIVREFTQELRAPRTEWLAAISISPAFGIKLLLSARSDVQR